MDCRGTNPNVNYAFLRLAMAEHMHNSIKKPSYLSAYWFRLKAKVLNPFIGIIIQFTLTAPSVATMPYLS